MVKIKITPGMLETEAGIERLEGNGHDRTSIHKALYNITDGASVAEQRAIMTKLYKRDRSNDIPKKQRMSRWI